METKNSKIRYREPDTQIWKDLPCIAMSFYFSTGSHTQKSPPSTMYDQRYIVAHLKAAMATSNPQTQEFTNLLLSGPTWVQWSPIGIGQGLSKVESLMATKAAPPPNVKQVKSTGVTYVTTASGSGSPELKNSEGPVMFGSHSMIYAAGQS